MNPYKRMAFLITFGELEGRKFDWHSMSWLEEK
jgi:hypothetical protein